MNGKITMSRRGRTGRTSGTFGVSSLLGAAAVISSVMIGVLAPALRRTRKASAAENAGVLAPTAAWSQPRPGGSPPASCSRRLLPLDGDHGRTAAAVLQPRHR